MDGGGGDDDVDDVTFTDFYRISLLFHKTQVDKLNWKLTKN